MTTIASTRCTCLACQRNGTPLPGISVHPKMHITAEDIGGAPAAKPAEPKPVKRAAAILHETVLEILKALKRGDKLVAKLEARIEQLEKSTAELGYKGVWRQ